MKGFVQRLLVDLRHVVALEAVQVHLDRACVGVLGHELPAQSVQLLLDVLRELQGVDAGPIQRHRLRPHLFNIDAGSRFVFQDMNFRLSFVHQHRQEAPVGGTVEGYLYSTSAWGFAHWENMERKEVLVELEEGEKDPPVQRRGPNVAHSRYRADAGREIGSCTDDYGTHAVQTRKGPARYERSFRAERGGVPFVRLNGSECMLIVSAILGLAILI